MSLHCGEGQDVHRETECSGWLYMLRGQLHRCQNQISSFFFKRKDFTCQLRWIGIQSVGRNWLFYTDSTGNWGFNAYVGIFWIQTCCHGTLNYSGLTSALFIQRCPENFCREAQNVFNFMLVFLILCCRPEISGWLPSYSILGPYWIL